MFFQKYAAYLLVLPLFAFISCAQQPLSSVAGKNKTVYLDPDIKVPKHYVYHDLTGKRTRGIVGGLLGFAIGAATEGPAAKRFDATAKKNPIDIKMLVRRDMESALRTATFVKMSPAPNA